MNLKSLSPRALPLAFAALLTAGYALTNFAHAAPVRTTTSGTTGGSCTVTEGKNKGKTGTYTVEEGTGATWCEGSWGGTECTGGRCKDGASKAISTISGGLIYQPKSFSFTK